MTKDQILELFNQIKTDAELKVEFFELMSESSDFVETLLMDEDTEEYDDDYDDEYDDESEDESSDESEDESSDETDGEPENLVEDASIKSSPQHDVDDN